MNVVVSRLAIACVNLIVISLMFTSISDAKIDPETVAGMWLFDEGNGKVAKDTSGNGNDGELMNDPNRKLNSMQRQSVC